MAKPILIPYFVALLFAAAIGAEPAPENAPAPSGADVVNIAAAAATATAPDLNVGRSGTISFPVEISLDELQTLINDKAPPSFDKEKEKSKKDFSSLLKDDWIEYHVQRGTIDLIPLPARDDVGGDVLGFSIPVSGTCGAGGKFLKVIPASAGLNFSGNIVGSIRASLKPDWSPDVQTAFDVEFDTATVKLLHAVGFSFKDHLRDELRKRAPSIEKSLLRQIDLLNIPKRVEPFWAQMHKTIRLMHNPPSWIQLKPSALAMSTLRFDEKRLITFNVDVDFMTTTFLGDKPPDQVAGPMPSLGRAHETGNAFKVSAPSYVDLATAAKFIEKQFFPLKADVSKTVGVTFLKLAMCTDEGKVKCTVEVAASGGMFGEKSIITLNATAMPKLDAEKRELRFEDLKYTVDTANYLAKYASDLLQPVVLEKLQEKARFDFGALLEKSREKVNEIMVSKKAGNHLEINVHFDKMKVTSLAVLDGKIVIYSDAEGELAMKLHP